MDGRRDGIRVLSRTATADGEELRIAFDANASAFAGHFPGEPLLPAAGQIALLARFLRDSPGGGASIASLERARWTGPIRPEDTVTVRWSRDDDSVRFEWRIGERVVSSGRLRVTAARP